MLKKTLYGLLAIIAVFAVYVAFQPDEYRVERSIVINTTPDKVFPHVNSLAAWHAWSPWAKLDPNAKVTFEGPAEGTGNVMHWAGNKEVGAGNMTIAESHPSAHIKIDLKFLEPWPGQSTSEFTFAPEGTGTKVTWAMHGTESSFIAKAMWVAFCKYMLGNMYQEGLTNLKNVVETTPAK